MSISTRTWLAIWVVFIGALCYRSLNSDLFPFMVIISFVSSGALVATVLKTGGSANRRYSLLVGILVFVLTALALLLKVSST